MARSTYFRSEAEFQAELALENQIAADLLKLQKSPQKPSYPEDISLSKKEYFETDRRRFAASEILSHISNPALKKPAETVPEGEGNQIYQEYQPGALRPEFRIFGKQRTALVYTAGFPFAAYAPKGSIQLEECYPGGNPPPGKIKGVPQDFRSGIPVFIGAGQKVQVKKEFPFGEVFVKSNEAESISLPETEGVLLHPGFLPLDGKQNFYCGRLQRELDAAFTQLGEAAESGDKSSFIMGKSPLNARTLLTCLLSIGDGKFSDIAAAFTIPSINQGMAFPLPVIPTVSVGLVYNEITIHFPFPPDQGLYSTLQSEAGKLADQAGAQLDKLHNPLVALQQKVKKLREDLDGKVSAAVEEAARQASVPLNAANQELAGLYARSETVNANLQKARTNLSYDPANVALRSALTLAESDWQTVRGNIRRVEAQVATLQNELDRAKTETKAKVQAQYGGELDGLQTQLKTLTEEYNRYLEQAKAFAKESASAIVAALPTDPGGLKTRAQEAESAINETLGAPGFNYIAAGLLFGRRAMGQEQEKLQQGVFKMVLGHLKMFCPGGKLAEKVQTPEQLAKLIGELYSSSVLLDPDLYEVAYKMRNLSIKQAVLEYLEPLLDSIPQNEVRLFDFGDPNNPTGEIFEFEKASPGMQATGFKSECTWNVPPGRSLTLRGDVTVKGDVWVQRGACMRVDGNLTVVRPPARSFRGIDNPLSPMGRIFLEPGATLLVDKDLRVEGGSALSGSVVVEAPLGQASSITSGILCKGDVTLKFGIHPGISLENLFVYVANLTESKEMLEIHKKLLAPLLTDIAPNAAKIFGPFHIRPPYISQFATTISLYLIIPAPGPPYPNIMVKIFRLVASVYGVSLNAALGENLYTHSDWWLFGDGVVPIVPRVDAVTLIDSLRQMRFPVPQVPDIQGFFEQRLQMFAQKVVTKIIGDVVATCFAEVIKALTSVLQIGKQLTATAGTVIDTVLSQFKTSIEDLIQEFEKELELSVKAAIKELVIRPLLRLVRDLLDQVLTSVEKSVLRDAPGALIYAQGKLTIGSESEPATLALGMFVAKGDVTIFSDHCVGSMISFGGGVRAKKLIFMPHFTGASFYIPKDAPNWNSVAWPAALVVHTYGSKHSSHRSIDVGPSVYHVTSRGWTQ